MSLGKKLGYNKLSSNTSLFPVQFRFMFSKKSMFIKYVDYKYSFKPLFPSTILGSVNNTRIVEGFPAVGNRRKLLKQICSYLQLVHLFQYA